MSNNNQSFLIIESGNMGTTPLDIVEDKHIVRFKAKLQDADTPNRNNRIYGKDTIQKAMEHYTVKEKMAHKAFYGRICPSI